MPAFTYSNPSVIHWGAGSVDRLPAELERLDATHFALVTTRSLLAETGRLPAAPVATVVIGQHAPVAQVDAGVEQAAGAGGIVSFGGGSAIDAAKIISVRLADAGGRALPHIAVPTTLSAAELAAGAGYTNADGDKAGMRAARVMAQPVIHHAGRTPAPPLHVL